MTSSHLRPSDDLATLSRRLAEARLFHEAKLDTAEKQILFLYVARHPGHGLIDMQNELGLHRAMVSRLIMVLGTRRKGLGLIQAERPPDNLRGLEVRLTAKGEQLLARLSKALSE